MSNEKKVLLTGVTDRQTLRKNIVLQVPRVIEITLHFKFKKSDIYKNIDVNIGYMNQHLEKNMQLYQQEQYYNIIFYIIQ